jgi:hypothetical protein
MGGELVDGQNGLDETEAQRLAELCDGLEGGDFVHEYNVAFDGRSYRVSVNKNLIFVVVVATCSEFGSLGKKGGIMGLSFWLNLKTKALRGTDARQISAIKAFLQGYQIEG